MRRNIFIQIVVFLTAILVSTIIVWRLEQNRHRLERARISDVAGDHAHALQATIERSLSATYALAAMVRQGKGTITDFDATAAEMLPFYPGVASLQLAPDGIVRQIVPLAGNEGAIGHNLLKDPARNKEAFLARDTGKLTLAGPFNLKQGGIGAVGRLPVFIDSTSGQRSFWGFTIALIRFPEVLNPAQLSNLEERGFRYELWRYHPDSGKRQIIAASSTTPLGESIDHHVYLPNGTWILSVAPVDGWRDQWGLALKAATGVAFSLLLLLLIRSLLNTRTVALQMAEHLTSELSEREREFRTLAENSPDTIIRYDRDCRRIYVNPAFVRTTGIPTDRALGTPTPEDWQASIPLADYQECLKRVMATGTPAEIIFDWPDKNGNAAHHYIRAIPEQDTDGVINGVLVIGRDVTELKDSEDRVRLVFENSPVSIWEEDFSAVKAFFDRLKRQGVEDLDEYFDQHPESVRECAEMTRIVDVNRAALALHGAEDKQTLLAGLVSTFTDESFATFRKELVCIWKGNTTMRSDSVVKTLAGEPHIVTVYFTICPGYEQNLSKVLVSLVDITERKLAEEQLKTLNEELEKRVRTRTAEIEAKNVELEKMNRMFVGRELRMVELKDRIRELEQHIDELIKGGRA